MVKSKSALNSQFFDRTFIEIVYFMAGILLIFYV
ncbi:unknown [[Mannheimia] succiniciproducens MBEL55E]|uniref:Uncharacterized protein n=1 Tax=Mannheimia succiniciproducens (strain KCTC 0769BP / MBEL55E) TaxID=221988 RepID=Q65T18_MANSM|nr:unknown [[Mannheimia] succiniciproducens MBEL55E]